MRPGKSETLGALLGLTEEGGTLDGYRNMLDEVANALASSVNSLHTATPFFTGTTAATLAVAVAPSEVQTSSTEAPGGNDVALAIAALRGGAADQRYSGSSSRWAATS